MRIQAGGLGIDREATGTAQLREVAWQAGQIEQTIAGFHARRVGGGSSARAVFVRDRGRGRSLEGRRELGHREAEAGINGGVDAAAAIDHQIRQRRQIGHVHQRDHAAGMRGLGDEGPDLFLLLALQLVDVGEHRFQRAVFSEQLGGGLGPDAIDAGNVVRGVADHAQVIDHLIGTDAFFGEQFSWPAQQILACIPGGNALGQDLIDVLVLGQHAHAETAGGSLLGVGDQDIVSFEAVAFDDRAAGGREQLLHIGKLHRQHVRRGIAMGLVFRIEIIAEAAGGVEDRDPVRHFAISAQILQQIGVGVGDSGRPPTRPGERGHAEEVAICVVMPVNEGQ